MTRILTLAAIQFIAVTLAGCPALEAIEGKPSPAKAAQERRAALTLTVEPAVQQVAFVQPVQPECVTEWRIRRCIDGEAVQW